MGLIDVLDRLSARLRARFGEGFGVRTLRSIRRFYLVFPEGSAVPEIRKALPAKSTGSEIRKAVLSEFTQRFPLSLGWTHYLILMKVANPAARAFYAIEAARQAWSTRQLERQIAALLYERLATNRTPDKVLAPARNGQEVAKPSDIRMLGTSLAGILDAALAADGDIDHLEVGRFDQLLRIQ